MFPPQSNYPCDISHLVSLRSRHELGMIPSPASPPVDGVRAAVTRDSEFYMDIVFFEVEGHIFRVPRRNFEERSAIFRDMFSMRKSDENVSEGTLESHPITLSGIEQTDFRQLLRVMFPVEPGQYSLSESEWISALKLATMWEFAWIRELCVKRLTNSKMLSDDEKFKLGREYEIAQWILPTLNILAKRREPLGIEDFDRLGLDWTLKLAAVRESTRAICNVCNIPLHSSTMNCSGISCRNKHISVLANGQREDVSHVNFTPKIRALFGI